MRTPQNLFSVLESHQQQEGSSNNIWPAVITDAKRGSADAQDVLNQLWALIGWKVVFLYFFNFVAKLACTKSHILVMHMSMLVSIIGQPCCSIYPPPWL